MNDKHMEEEKYISIMSEYYDFRSFFSDNINNPTLSLKNEDCYLIEGNWIDDLKRGFNKYKNLKKTNELNKNFNYCDLIPETQPNFINDIFSILDFIKNNKNFKFTSKKLLEIIYNNNHLKNHHYIKYYSGNDKLIIEYENDNKAILFINPLNQREIKNINIVLIKDEQKNQLFQNILSSSNNIPDEYLKNIIPFDIYYKLSKILKLLTYFYYYEKDLKEKKEFFFNENDKDYYYLINPDWLIKFKDKFNYSEIYESLKLIDSKNKNINYNNLINYFGHIISQLNENIINREKELFDEIFNGEQIKLRYDKIDNILNYKKSYIISSQIMNIIKSFFNDKEINFDRKRIFHFNNNIYLIYENKVIIGKLNEILIFIAQYIIIYNSKELLESERNNLLNNTIEKYLNNLNCDLSNPNLQILNLNNQSIGKLIVLNVTKSKDKIENLHKKVNQNKNVTELNNSSKKKSIENIKFNTELNNSSKKKSIENIKFNTEYNFDKKKINYIFGNIDDNQNKTKKK